MENGYMVNKNIAKTSTEALKILWREKLFWGSKKYVQIEERLGKKGYHFSSAELCTALNRAKYLTRKGNKGNYEYIQKHPYCDDEFETKSKKINL